MANNNTLKSDIRQYIYSNQNEEITGNILRDVLLEMVDTLGDGWTYKGVATTTTNPGTPDDNVFYIATAPGTYTNFGGLSVVDGEVAILKYNGSWAKDVTGAATSAQVTQLGQDVTGIIPFPLDGFINPDGTQTSSQGYRRTNFIAVTPGEKMSYKGGIGTGFLCIAGYSTPSESSFVVSPLTGGDYIDEVIVTIPENVNYIVACSRESNIYSLVRLGAIIPQIEDDLSEVSNDIKNSVIGGQFSIVGFYSNDGTYTESIGYHCSDLIPVKEGQIYEYAGSMGGSFSCVLGYGSDRMILSNPTILAGVTNVTYIGAKITIPNGVSYIRAQSKDSVEYSLLLTSELGDKVADNKNNINKLQYSVKGVDFPNIGYISGTGEFIPSDGYHHTNLKPVNTGEKFLYSGRIGAIVSSIYGFSDETFANPVSLLAGGNVYDKQEVTIPAGVNFIIAQSADDTPYILFSPSLLYEQIPNLAQCLANEYYGKKINWLGDSITAGNFDNKVAAYFGMTENDYGIGGTTIAKNSNDSRYSMAVRYTSMADNADVIVVSGGTNDYQYDWTPFGQMGDNSVDTFYGALDVLCRGLIAKYPNKIIFFTTPIKRNQDNNGGDYTHYPYDTQQDIANGLGKTLKDYCDAIKQVCAKYSIPVCDMYSESLLNPNMSAQEGYFDAVGTHPNDIGTDMMARRVIGFMKQLC